MQPAHLPGHELVLRPAGAVAGVKHGAAAVQLPGVAGQRLVQRQAIEMEAAHQDVRPEPVHDVQDPLVGAPADEDPPARLLDQQVVLVPEVLGLEGPALLHRQTKAAQVVPAGLPVAGGKGQARRQDRLLPGQVQPGAGRQGGVKADVPLRAVVMGLEGVFVEVDRRGAVQLQKAGQPAAVVVVPMGEDRQVHRREIDPQSRRVAGKEAALPHIEQNLVPAGLDVKGEAVFLPEAQLCRQVLRDRVFHQCRDLQCCRRLSENGNSIIAHPAPKRNLCGAGA